jgi:hypothetical protein
MTPRQIEILFDEDRTVFAPGEELAGQFLVVPNDGQALKAVEVSVLWQTEGKGDDDLGVTHFERIEANTGAADLLRPISFRTRLPNSPLSYHGQILRIVWCVRVRAFPQRGNEIVAEERFQLGNVPAPIGGPVSEPQT